MATSASEIKNLFPLSVLAPRLENFRPPTGAFDPEGQWELTYGVHTVGQVGVGRAGSLRLRRTPRRGGSALHVDYQKISSAQHVHVVTGEIRCRGDALATPESWRFAAESRTPTGDLVPNTRIEKQVTAKNGSIEVRDGQRARRSSLPFAYTVNWALFDVVQRQPRGGAAPLRFTLFDDFDQVKPDLTLSYWKAATVMLGGRRVQRHEWEQLEKGRIRKTSWGREGDRPLRLHGFSLLGPGTVPWVYWVDDQGRLLFAVAGLEAYILETGQAVRQ